MGFLPNTISTLVLGVFLSSACFNQLTPQTKNKARHTKQVALIAIGKKQFWVEYAKTFTERQLGLMYRPTPVGDRGMLFQAESAHTQSFWMQNTPSKLDIGFFDTSNSLCDIYALEPFNTKSVYSSKRGKLALEMHRGWFKKNGIQTGSKIKIIQIRGLKTSDLPKLPRLGH